jgi:hypothetical protein
LWKTSPANGTGLLTCALFFRPNPEEQSLAAFPKPSLQWHFGLALPASPSDLTQEHTLTVAGQWRIFTAFPIIPSHKFFVTANTYAGRSRHAFAPIRNNGPDSPL